MSRLSLPFLAAALLLAGCGEPETGDAGGVGPVGEERGADDAAAGEAASLRDVIEAEPRFATLAAALDAADLMTTLDEEGPITIFAPTNDAFSALPGAVSVDVLTAPQNQALLRDILAYHVVPGRVGSRDLLDNPQDLETVSGKMLRIDGSGAVVSVGNAVMTIPDIEAANGIIHTIDTVLLPPAD
jgi:uncharacterized surface protein with fasciclin (FAS1) repeats